MSTPSLLLPPAATPSIIILKSSLERRSCRFQGHWSSGGPRGLYEGMDPRIHQWERPRTGQATGKAMGYRKQPAPHTDVAPEIIL